MRMPVGITVGIFLTVAGVAHLAYLFSEKVNRRLGGVEEHLRIVDATHTSLFMDRMDLLMSKVDALGNCTAATASQVFVPTTTTTSTTTTTTPLTTIATTEATTITAAAIGTTITSVDAAEEAAEKTPTVTAAKAAATCQLCSRTIARMRGASAFVSAMRSLHMGEDEAGNFDFGFYRAMYSDVVWNDREKMQEHYRDIGDKEGRMRWAFGDYERWHEKFESHRGGMFMHQTDSLAPYTVWERPGCDCGGPNALRCSCLLKAYSLCDVILINGDPWYAYLAVDDKLVGPSNYFMTEVYTYGDRPDHYIAMATYMKEQENSPVKVITEQVFGLFTPVSKFWWHVTHDFFQFMYVYRTGGYTCPVVLNYSWINDLIEIFLPPGTPIIVVEPKTDPYLFRNIIVTQQFHNLFNLSEVASYVQPIIQQARTPNLPIITVAIVSKRAPPGGRGQKRVQQLRQQQQQQQSSSSNQNSQQNQLTDSNVDPNDPYRHPFLFDDDEYGGTVFDDVDVDNGNSNSNNSNNNNNNSTTTHNKSRSSSGGGSNGSGSTTATTRGPAPGGEFYNKFTDAVVAAGGRELFVGPGGMRLGDQVRMMYTVQTLVVDWGSGMANGWFLDKGAILFVLVHMSRIGQVQPDWPWPQGVFTHGLGVHIYPLIVPDEGMDVADAFHVMRRVEQAYRVEKFDWIEFCKSLKLEGVFKMEFMALNLYLNRQSYPKMNLLWPLSGDQRAQAVKEPGSQPPP